MTPLLKKSKSIAIVSKLLSYALQRSIPMSCIKHADIFGARVTGSSGTGPGPNMAKDRTAVFTLKTVAADTLIRAALKEKNIMFSHSIPPSIYYSVPIARGITDALVQQALTQSGLLLHVYKYVYTPGAVSLTIDAAYSELMQHSAILELCRNPGIGAYRAVRSKHRVCNRCWQLKDANHPPMLDGLHQCVQVCGTCGVPGHTHRVCTSSEQVPCLLPSSVCAHKEDGHVSHLCIHYVSYFQSTQEQTVWRGGLSPPKPVPSAHRADPSSPTLFTESRHATQRAGPSYASVTVMSRQSVPSQVGPVDVSNSVAVPSAQSAGPSDAPQSTTPQSLYHTLDPKGFRLLDGSTLAVSSPSNDPNGYGLFAKVNFIHPSAKGFSRGSKGAEICQYVGTRTEYRDNTTIPTGRYVFVSRLPGKHNRFIMDASDETRYGMTYGRYANSPNTAMGQTANAQFRVREGKVYLHTLKHITRGQEILVDYPFQSTTDAQIAQAASTANMTVHSTDIGSHAHTHTRVNASSSMPVPIASSSVPHTPSPMPHAHNHVHAHTPSLSSLPLSLDAKLDLILTRVDATSAASVATAAELRTEMRDMLKSLNATVSRLRLELDAVRKEMDALKLAERKRAQLTPANRGGSGEHKSSSGGSVGSKPGKAGKCSATVVPVPVKNAPMRASVSKRKQTGPVDTPESPPPKAKRLDTKSTPVSVNTQKRTPVVDTDTVMQPESTVTIGEPIHAVKRSKGSTGVSAKRASGLLSKTVGGASLVRDIVNDENVLAAVMASPQAKAITARGLHKYFTSGTDPVVHPTASARAARSGSPGDSHSQPVMLSQSQSQSQSLATSQLSGHTPAQSVVGSDTEHEDGSEGEVEDSEDEISMHGAHTNTDYDDDDRSALEDGQ